MRRSAIAIGRVALFLTAACGPGAKGPSGGEGRVCAIQLLDRPPQNPISAPALAEPPFAAPTSTIVVHVQIPVAIVQRALEGKVPHRVAEEKDHDLGVAGRLEYTADRGPFRVSAKGDALLVATTVDIAARACAKGSCFASCEPRAEVTARVPLRLGADYKFKNPTVTIALTRGCQVRALGGFATIDVSPQIDSELQAMRPRLEQQIRAELPDLRPETERMWKDLVHARPLALGSCMRVLPEGIVQGKPLGEGDTANLSFGLIAHPELQTRCGDDPFMPRLPPLKDDDALPREGSIYLSVVLPKEAPAASMEGANVDLGSAHAHIGHADGATTQGLSLQLTGEACGIVTVQSPGAAWMPDGHSVHLARTVLLPGEPERFAAARAEPDAFLRGLEKLPIPVPVSAAEIGAMLPDLAKSESSPKLDVSAAISSTTPDSAGLRGRGEVIAVTLIKGAVTLRPK